MQHVACFIYYLGELGMQHVLSILPRRTGHAACVMFYLYYLGELDMQHAACFIYITRRAGQWACSMQHVLSILPRRTGHAACSMFYLYYLGELGMQHVTCTYHCTLPHLYYARRLHYLELVWNSEIIKETVSVISVTFHAQRCLCPIHNDTLETFIWSIMWEIMSFFLVQKCLNLKLLKIRKKQLTLIFHFVIAIADF